MVEEKPLILLLHPDDCYRTVLAYVLTQHQFEVRLAANPAQCGEACRGNRPSLILLDWHFCGDNPGAFLTTLRKEPVMHQVPAMLVGPPTSRDAIKTAGKQGVAAIMIPQGFTIEGFITKVRSAMGQAPASENDPANSDSHGSGVQSQIPRMTQGEIESQMRRLPPVGVLQSTVDQLLHAAGDLAISSQELADVVMRDPGATLHLLGRVNATQIRLERELICRVGEAIHLVGVREFHNFVQDIPIISDDSPQKSSWASEMWRGGMLAASRVAALLAERLGWSDPREMRAIGLLHNLGHPSLLAMNPNVTWPLAGHDGLRIVDTERRALRMDHATVGGMLLHASHLPPWVVEAVLNHHVPEALRPSISRQARDTIIILQAVDQILAALVGYPGMHDVLEGFSEETLKAMEDARLDTEKFTEEAIEIIEETTRELTPQASNAVLEPADPPALTSAAYVNPKRMPMDAVKLFAGRCVAELREIPVSQMEATAARMPLIVNFCAVRGDAALAAMIDHLPREGAHGIIFFSDNARPSVIQQLESTGWLCVRLPAPVAGLREMLKQLIPVAA